MCIWDSSSSRSNQRGSVSDDLLLSFFGAKWASFFCSFCLVFQSLAALRGLLSDALWFLRLFCSFVVFVSREGMQVTYPWEVHDNGKKIYVSPVHFGVWVNRRGDRNVFTADVMSINLHHRSHLHTRFGISLGSCTVLHRGVSNTSDKSSKTHRSLQHQLFFVSPPWDRRTGREQCSQSALYDSLTCNVAEPKCVEAVDRHCFA